MEVSFLAHAIKKKTGVEVKIGRVTSLGTNGQEVTDLCFDYDQGLRFLVKTKMTTTVEEIANFSYVSVQMSPWFNDSYIRSNKESIQVLSKVDEITNILSGTAGLGARTTKEFELVDLRNELLNLYTNRRIQSSQTVSSLLESVDKFLASYVYDQEPQLNTGQTLE